MMDMCLCAHTLLACDANINFNHTASLVNFFSNVKTCLSWRSPDTNTILCLCLRG